MKILITGVAGFIGFGLAKRFLQDGHEVIGIDSLNDYYAVQLKKDRLAQIQDYSTFTFIQEDIANTPKVAEIFAKHNPSHVINLGGQAGVRHSITHPYDYIQANLVGFGNILECSRQHKVEHLLFASSSSVYGLNSSLPYRVENSVNHPVSLYAATKKSNELMAHSYAHLYNLPVSGLRFFTVYGPWGRPDMAPHLFTSAILEDRPIKVFNYGKMQRDFTYIDDIVESVVRLTSKPSQSNSAWDSLNPDPATSSAPYKIYNIGNSNTVELMTFIETIENALGKEAIKEFLPMQDGDVHATYADTSALEKITGFVPQTDLKDGIENFIRWHLSYYVK